MQLDSKLLLLMIDFDIYA